MSSISPHLQSLSKSHRPRTPTRHFRTGSNRHSVSATFAVADPVMSENPSNHKDLLNGQSSPLFRSNPQLLCLSISPLFLKRCRMDVPTSRSPIQQDSRSCIFLWWQRTGELGYHLCPSKTTHLCRDLGTLGCV